MQMTIRMHGYPDKVYQHVEPYRPGASAIAVYTCDGEQEIIAIDPANLTGSIESIRQLERDSTGQELHCLDLYFRHA